jgi:hypothetical protein
MSMVLTQSNTLYVLVLYWAKHGDTLIAFSTESSPEACTLKLRIRSKLMYFILSVTSTLALTNTLAYYDILILLIHNVL